MEKFFGSYGFYKQKYNKRNYDYDSQIKLLISIVDLLLEKGYGQIDSSIDKNYGNAKLVESRYEINEFHVNSELSFIANTRFKFDGISEEDMNLVRDICDSYYKKGLRKFNSKYMYKFDDNPSLSLYENEKEYHEYNNYEFIIITFNRDALNKFITEEKIEKEKQELKEILNTTPDTKKRGRL